MRDESRCNLSLVIAAAFMAVAIGASAQQYPSKPIRIVVPYAPGGNVDLVARAIAPSMSAGLGQQVVVDNRPGSSGILGAQIVGKSPPDGYTLLAMANTFAVVPSVVANPGYDPLKGYSGVSLTCLVPQVLVVNTALPVRSIKDLVALAKSRPGELSYASAGVAGTGHLAAELFSRHNGIRMLHVPYKGNSQAVVDVIGGQVTMMFDQVSTSAPHVKAGKLRALAVTSLKRSALFPDVPTMDAAGMRGYEDITFNGLVAPAGTPREILTRLNSEVARAVRAPEVHKRYLELGVELTASPTPEDFTAYIKTEFDKKAKLVKEAGIRIE